MTRSQLLIGFVLTLVITVAGGWMHGRLSGRWGGSLEALEAGRLIESFPEQVGQWRLEESSSMGQSELDMLQPYGYVSRTYVHLETGQKVSLFVLVGPVGQVAVHNPEVCYSSREYTITQPKELVTLRVDGHRTDQFWSTTFHANSLEGGWLRTYYAWSGGNAWEASDNGRIKFAGLPYLYKLQLAAYTPESINPSDTDACRAFLTDFLAVLRSHMKPVKA